MKKLDPKIAEVLKEDGFGHDAVWDCHGVWVAYHKVLEQIAAKRGIAFQPPQIVEANGKEGVAAICVTGTLADRSEWSIGEASPKNNKNAYPWAMAEKRAKDRVILKLIGLHGLVYSEEEADDVKRSAPVAEPTPRDMAEEFREDAKTKADLAAFNAFVSESQVKLEAIRSQDSALHGRVMAWIETYRENLTRKEAA